MYAQVKKRSKVLIVSQWFVSADSRGIVYMLGGVERWAYDLAKWLGNSGYEVMVLSTTTDKNEVGFKVLNNINLYRYKIYSNSCGTTIDLLSFRNTLKTIKKFNPDIVHIISSKYRFAIGAIVAAKILSKKVIETVTTLPKSKKWFVNFFDNLICTRILNKVDVITYSTPNLWKYVSHIRNDSLFIPNYVDTSLFKPNNPSIKSINDLPRILIANNLSYIKGGDIAFRAIEIVRKEYPHLECAALVRVRSTDREVKKERQTIDTHPVITENELKKENIKILPNIPYDMMPNIINRYDIILGQFRLGALGRLELEVMACGKPLICFFEYLDWYGKNPHLISTNSPIEIAKNIKELIINKDLREKMGTDNREWVEKNHNINSTFQDILQIYEQILNTP